MRLLIKRLKTILQSNYFYILLLILLSLSYIFNKSNDSIYSLDDHVFYLVVEDFTLYEDKVSFIFKGEEDLVGTYYFKGNDINISYGSKVKVKGDLVIPSHETIPNNFDYHDYLKRKGINYQIKISSIEVIEESNSFIYKIKNWVYKRIMGIDDSGYMMSFILGDKSYLPDKEYNMYQNIGIAHLFSISGMHISLITGLILKVLKKLNKEITFMVISIVLILYGFLVMFPASVLRCIIFFIINGFNKIFHLNISSIKILFMTAFIVLIMNKNYLYDTGFLYSFFSVFGIFIANKWISKNYSFVRLSIIAFLFTLPISLYSFYSINILSIIYNLFFIPFVSILLYPSILISFVVPHFYFVCHIELDILISLSTLLNKISFSSIHLSLSMIECIVFYIFLIIFIKTDKKHFLLFCLLIIFFHLVFPYFDKESKVIFFDVKQGDSSLVMLPYRKKVILIDTGGIRNSDYYVSDDVIKYLYSQGISKIDYLIISHGDYDHMGEIINYIDKIKIGYVIFNGDNYDDLELSIINELSKNGINYCNNCSLSIKDLKIIYSHNYSNENDNSNIVLLNIDNYKFLYMGDASCDRETELIKKYNLTNIDILKVGHHGSKSSSCSSFIDIINPKYSIISVGKNNKYGHPNKEVLNNLEKSKIYRTDLDGTIMFKIKDNKMHIETFNP